MRNRTLSVVRIRAAVRFSSYAVAALALGSSTCLAAPDATAGQQVFASLCSGCHATEPNVNKIGPSLAGVLGRKSGSETGFNYSSALKAAAITWDEKTLDEFIQNPNADVHGTKMFVSVPGNDDRQNVIAYLKTLKP
jgi:cytochrome c